MSDRPDLSEKFGKRIGTAYRLDPEKGPDAWVAETYWDIEQYWVVCVTSGIRAYMWDYAQELLGEEEESGRFVSNARDYILKSETDAAAFKAKCDGDYADVPDNIAWWDGFQA